MTDLTVAGESAPFARPLPWQRPADSIRERDSATSEVVVVTGASAGVGRAVVRRFAQARAQIGLLARGLDGLEGARREVEAAGGRAP